MEDTLSVTRSWVESVVVKLNLCPFAGHVLKNNRLRLTEFDGDTELGLLEALKAEIAFLDANLATETTLLIHPYVLQDFDAYNQFLCRADELMVAQDREGVYQVASFHPQYQFAGTDPDAAENYTNRSPYPMLHLLRESSVEEAIQNHPDVKKIPENNIDRMNAIGATNLANLLQTTYQPADK